MEYCVKLTQKNCFINQGVSFGSSLKGKVAIVRGALWSIRRAIAERLVRDGSSIVINYSGG
jgi:hypothetical protein